MHQSDYDDEFAQPEDHPSWINDPMFAVFSVFVFPVLVILAVALFAWLRQS